jgi:hypothetical protein
MSGKAKNRDLTLKIHQQVDFQHLRIDFRDSKTWKNEVREAAIKKMLKQRLTSVQISLCSSPLLSPFSHQECKKISVDFCFSRI